MKQEVNENTELGVRMKDVITGFEGIAIARIKYLYGCTQYSLKPTKLDKDNKPIPAVTFDYQQLLIINVGMTETERSNKQHKGGIHPDMPIIN